MLKHCLTLKIADEIQVVRVNIVSIIVCTSMNLIGNFNRLSFGSGKKNTTTEIQSLWSWCTGPQSHTPPMWSKVETDINSAISAQFAVGY